MAAKLLVLAGAALRASCFRLPNKSAPIYIDKTTGEYLPEVDGVYDNPNYLEDYILWAQAQEEANAAKGTDTSATDTWGSAGVGAAGYDGSGGRSGAVETAVGDAGFGGAGGDGIGPAIGAGAGGAGAGAAGDAIESQPIPGGAGDISGGNEEGTAARVGEGQSVSDEGVVPVGGDAGASAGAGETGAGNASASATSVAELEKVVPDYIQDANNYLEYFNHYAEPKYNEDGENGTEDLTTKAPSAAMWQKVVVPQRELAEEKKEVKEVKEVKQLKEVKEVIEVNAAREEMKAAQNEKKEVKEVKKEAQEAKKELKESPAVRDFHNTLKQFLGVKQGAATSHKHQKKAHAAPAPAHHVPQSASTAAPVSLFLRGKDDVKVTEELRKKMETKSVPSSDLEKMLYMRNAPEWYNNLMVNTLKEDGEQPEGHLNMEAPLTEEELAAGGLGVAPQPNGANPAVLVGELTPEELAERVLAEMP